MNINIDTRFSGECLLLEASHGSIAPEEFEALRVMANRLARRMRKPEWRMLSVEMWGAAYAMKCQREDKIASPLGQKGFLVDSTGVYDGFAYDRLQHIEVYCNDYRRKVSRYLD